MYFGDEPASELGSINLDSAIYYYQETEGRVRAIEPASTLSLTTANGSVLSVGVVYDTLTGATPNGATPWIQPQTFINPADTPTTTATHTTTTTTNASGTQVVTVTNGNTTVYGQQYTVDPHVLPTDKGFMDEREAVNASYSMPVAETFTANAGGSYSTESDYESITGNVGFTLDLNGKNTTLGFGIAYEHDTSAPHFGNPVPLTEMSAETKGPAETKSVTSVILGLTQVINRRWLAQINYSYGVTNGYQNDPYKIISLIDTAAAASLPAPTPAPGGGEDEEEDGGGGSIVATVPSAVSYLYESRPGRRIRQSVYVGSKIALGRAVTDVSARYYSDSWGIASRTFDIAERVPLNAWLYIEPHFRYYTQSAADFFRYYLVKSDPLPSYASADYRLAKFSATTLGAKVGFKVLRHGELYMRGEMYSQAGESHPAHVISALAGEDLFAGMSAVTFIAGYRHTF